MRRPSTIIRSTAPILSVLTRLSSETDVDIRVFRDDLYPFTGGGNKARKIQSFLPDILDKNCNALVTTGGLQSNHARVVALVAAAHHWKCTLVLHGDPAELQSPSGNLLLMKLAGAQIRVVSPDQIGREMQYAMRDLRRAGHQPYEIPGGGHHILGGSAYVKAVFELEEICLTDRWRPDWIVLASGTGTTQAGICTGIQQLGWHTRVVGISVARRNPRGKSIVINVAQQLQEHFNLPLDATCVDFRDDWVGDGYEMSTPTVLQTIDQAAREGIILDPTYTGKAFTGLLDMINSGEIRRGERVVFWHTGGLLNLLASSGTRLFFSNHIP